jgi:hypothetical protein
MMDERDTKMYNLRNLGMDPVEGKEETLSNQDKRDQLAVLAFAMHIHVAKEKVRRGLWKEYPALDQVRQIKIKAERIIQILERGEELDEATLASVLEEFGDIINYSVFGHRIVNGRADPRNTLR